MVKWTAPIPFNLVITSDSLLFVSEVAPKDTERRDDITNTKACDRQRLNHLGRKGAVLRAQCKNFLFLPQIDPKEKGGDPEQLMHIYIEILDLHMAPYGACEVKQSAVRSSAVIAKEQ